MEKENLNKKKIGIIIAIILLILVFVLFFIFSRKNDTKDTSGNVENYIKDDVVNTTNTNIKDEQFLTYQEVEAKIEEGKELYTTDGVLNKEEFFQWLEDEEIISKKENNVVDKGNGVYEITTTDGYKIIITIESIEDETTEEETKETSSTVTSGNNSNNNSNSNNSNSRPSSSESSNSNSNINTNQNNTSSTPTIPSEPQEEQKPEITNIQVSEASTNSFTVAVSANNANNVTYNYYLNGALKGSSSSPSYTFNDLKANTNYIVKVTITDSLGNVAEKEVAQTTQEVPTADANIIFGNLTWKDGKASVNITTTTGCNIEYQVNSTTGSWTKLATGNQVEKLENGDMLYARLTDGANKGNYASIEVKDSKRPSITNISTNSTTNNITINVTAQDNETGLADTNTYTYILGDKEIATTDTTYTFEGIEDNTEYEITVKVKDKAGNTQENKTTVTTKALPNIKDTVTFENVVWNEGKASITVNSSTTYTIEYKINTDENWIEIKNGETITNLNHEDKVYIRLTDNVNTTDTIETQILDEKAPIVTLTLDKMTTNSIKVSVTAQDNETGFDTAPTYTYYIKESTRDNTEYVEKTTTTDTTYTFSDLSDGTSYDIKVTVKDKVSNQGEGTLLNQTTGEVSDATKDGVITFENLVWSGIDNASIEISTNTDFDIEYQLNSYEETWSKYTEAITPLKHGDVVYARLTDGLNAGNYTSIEIKDTIKPVVTKYETTSTTNSIEVKNIEATDNQTGLATEDTYIYSIDGTEYKSTNNSYKFENLTANTRYTIQVSVIDKAGNITNVMPDNLIFVTKEMPSVQSNLTFGSVEWKNEKAKLTVTKADSITDDITIQYLIGNETDWKDIVSGEYITDIENGSTVYARLTDKTNNTESINTTINDTTKPTVNMNIDNVATNSIKITVNAQDNETGLKDDTTYTYYIKESTETDYNQDGDSSTKNTYTFTSLKVQTSYDIKVEVNGDKAGNVGTKEIKQSTANLPTAAGNVTFEDIRWENGIATIKINNYTSYSMKYKVNTDIEWKNVEIGTITGLKYADTVYVALAEGDIIGEPTSIVINEDVKPTASIELSKEYAGANEEITAKITLTDSESGIDLNNSKWIYNKISSYIGTDENSYTGTFTSENDKVTLAKTDNEDYYLHILAVDKANNKKEVIKRVRAVATTIEELEIGDRIYYNTGDTSVGDNGIIECIVLYDSSSEYGVQIISANTIGEDITIGNADTTVSGNGTGEIAMNSYNVALKRLYDSSQKYLNSIYATDARSVGSDPSEPDYNTTDTDTFYTNDEKYVKDLEQMEKLDNIKRSNKAYWLASRYTYFSSNYSTECHIRYIDANGDLQNSFCVSSRWNYYNGNGTYGLRPVFTLKDGLKVNVNEDGSYDIIA